MAIIACINVGGGGTFSDPWDGRGGHRRRFDLGVAKSVNLKAVRVLDCNASGSLSGRDRRINWVVTANRVSPAVANMSIECSGSCQSMDTAVSNAVAAGGDFHGQCWKRKRRRRQHLTRTRVERHHRRGDGSIG